MTTPPDRLREVAAKMRAMAEAVVPLSNYSRRQAQAVDLRDLADELDPREQLGQGRSSCPQCGTDCDAHKDAAGVAANVSRARPSAAASAAAGSTPDFAAMARRVVALLDRDCVSLGYDNPEIATELLVPMDDDDAIERLAAALHAEWAGGQGVGDDVLRAAVRELLDENPTLYAGRVEAALASVAVPAAQPAGTGEDLGQPRHRKGRDWVETWAGHIEESILAGGGTLGTLGFGGLMGLLKASMPPQPPTPDAGGLAKRLLNHWWGEGNSADEAVELLAAALEAEDVGTLLPLRTLYKIANKEREELAASLARVAVERDEARRQQALAKRFRNEERLLLDKARAQLAEYEQAKRDWREAFISDDPARNLQKVVAGTLQDRAERDEARAQHRKLRELAERYMRLLAKGTSGDFEHVTALRAAERQLRTELGEGDANG